MPPRRRTTTENFHQHSLNTKRTGDILREARERRGESIAEVSAAIKIRPTMLEAIEAGQFYGLTDPLYLKGFIRAYTDHVGLNEDEVLPFFRREYDEQETQQQLKQPLTPIEPKKSKLTPGWIVVGFLVTAVLIVAGYSYHQYVSVALTPDLQVESPVDNLTATDGQVEVKGKTDPDATLTLNGQSVSLEPNGNFVLTVGLAAGANTLQFKSINKLGKETVVARTVIGPASLTQLPVTPTPTPVTTPSSTTSAVPADQASASATPAPTPAQAVLVGVVVGPASAWLEATADGKSVFSGLLLPGATKNFTATSVLHLKTGNGGSTRILLNGVDQGLLGTDGQVVERDYHRSPN